MEQIISDVAIYLRKSRGDSEQDLDKHKRDLVELAQKNNWKYVLYSEIVSADTIDDRPKMIQLLDDVKNNLFDAVLVIDYDRLGRGNLADQARLKETFSNSDTFIITPQKVHNLRDDSDDMLTDFLGMMARFEYKQIKKRLQRGKRQGAKGGNWTNGIPPYPYKYDAENKKLVVDEEQRLVYNYMKEKLLNGTGLLPLAIELNNQGYRTNRDKMWHPNAILRLFTNEVHLGRVIFGKSKGSGHKHKRVQPIQQLPRSEWIVYENAHETVLTPEEFQKLKVTFDRNKLVHNVARQGKNVFSGILKCAKCGYGMGIQKRKTEKSDNSIVKPCNKTFLDGQRCHNAGIKLATFVDAVKMQLSQYEEDLTKQKPSIVGTEKDRLNLLLIQNDKQLDKMIASLSRIQDMYEMGDYTRDEYIERKDKRQLEIKELQDYKENIRMQLNYYENIGNQEKLSKVKELNQLWKDGTDEQINNALKSLIGKITYLREDNNVEINIHWL